MFGPSSSIERGTFGAIIKMSYSLDAIAAKTRVGLLIFGMNIKLIGTVHGFDVFARREGTYVHWILKLEIGARCQRADEEVS